MIYLPPSRHRVADIAITPFADLDMIGIALNQAPASGTWGTASQARFYPLYLLEPFTVAKAYWCNGATVGTDSIDLGIYRMTDMTIGRLDLIRSTGAVLSAGSANVVQETATWRVAATNLTTGVDSTDATTYTTASVTLKAGRLYLLSFVNTAASAAVISDIAGGPTWASRASTQYNSAAHRVSIWSGVPTVDYTGTIVVSFGATQTSGRWSLNEFSGVDTATNDGVVQGVVGTGSSTTPLATLAAFGSANNSTFGALANVADSTTTPGTNFRELSDLTTTTTPGSFLQTQWYEGNDTTVDGTITSGAWGACAVEIKADASPFIIPPASVGSPDIYIGMSMSGTTATIFRQNIFTGYQQSLFGVLILANTFPLPSSLTATAVGAASPQVPLAGFSSRSLIG
jgi:hypothetical protein